MFAVVSELDHRGHPIRASIMRNAIAHVDFFIVGKGEKIEIQMLGREGPVNMPFDEVMRVFSKTQDLAW